MRITLLSYLIKVKFKIMYYELCFPLTLQVLDNLLKKKRRKEKKNQIGGFYLCKVRKHLRKCVLKQIWHNAC